ncbi:MAG TPA: hypothetical protein VJZ78_06930 [Anaerolineales bacterium]|nr:hypothetical protein [Anaerolineales bacterium]
MSAGKQLETQQLLDNLRTEWKPFPDRFHELTPSQRSEYLQQQGFGSFHDLLAHILAWWEEAIKIINSILDLEELPRREYDLDVFNAAAIEHFKIWSENDLLIHFDNICNALVTMLVELPDKGLENPRINGWLDACLLEHYQEHKIPE